MSAMMFHSFLVFIAEKPLSHKFKRGPFGPLARYE